MGYFVKWDKKLPLKGKKRCNNQQMTYCFTPIVTFKVYKTCDEVEF